MNDQPQWAAHGAASDDMGVLAPLTFGQSPTPMVITDPRQDDNPIVLANPAFLDLCGYPLDEVIGRNCRFLQGPGSDQMAVAVLRQAVDTRAAASAELLNYRRDGAPYWMRVHVSPVHDATGRLVYFFAAQIDLTPQREAEALRAAEHRLLREVDHRAMNALALVQGIVRLSEADNVRAYAEAVQARVGALARAHEMLSAQGWAPTALGRIVSGELAGCEEARLRLEGPEILVGAQQVQPLTLALHELTSNATRHGALRRPSGVLAVRWDEVSDTVTLTWLESGCPGAAQGRAGFGTRMVNAIVKQQLRGSVRRSWRPDGLELTMTFPRQLEASG